MTVEERLECLERRANRYRNALVLLVMSVCAVALIGATNAVEVDKLTELTADPTTIDEDARERQNTRFSRILGSGLSVDSDSVILQNALEDIARIKRELPSD